MRPSLLVTLASDLRIQTARLHLPVETNAGFPDLGLRTALLGSETPFDEELPPLDIPREKLQVWMVRDSFRCHYFLGSNPERDQIWMLGPYLTEDLTLGEINRRYERIGLKNVDMQFLRQYYHVLPRIRDENLMFSIVHNHCVETYGADKFEIAYWEMPFRHIPRAAKNEPAGNDYQRDALEFVYSVEKRMMACIAQGNLNGAVAAIHRLERKGLEARTTSTVRDMKNFSIVFNTLCRIAARDGGVHPVDIDRFSREISIQIENSSGVKELTVIREAMLREYCAMVRAVGKQTLSPSVRQAADLAEADFGRHVSVKEAADRIGLSPNYLSRLFRKETGKSFSEYLTEVRLSHARQLLAETGLPIAAVAAECGIPDNNYFSRLFRSRENKTPKEYRLLHRRGEGKAPDPDGAANEGRMDHE